MRVKTNRRSFKHSGCALTEFSVQEARASILLASIAIKTKPSIPVMQFAPADLEMRGMMMEIRLS